MTTPLKINTSSLIVIDSRVTDWQSLIGDIAANATLLVLDPLRDGLTQIAEAVANSVNIDAIHIISHGNVGSLLLGSSTLNSSNLSDYQAQLASIGNALSINGDILLYGCDVAQGDIGQQFIEQLSVLTGADIAASTDLTGAANQGGDWVLEAQTGAIESSTISLQTYTSTLITNIAPTLTTFNSPVQTGAVNSSVTITFADLLAKGNAADSDGNIHAFVIKAVNSGTLQFYDYINPAVGAPYWSTTPRAWGNPASSPNVNDTLYNGANKAIWTPSASDTGIVNAFTVVALDNSFTESATPVQATIQLTSNTPAATLGVFFATDATHGTELWVTDGTTAGTHLLKDIYAGTASSPLYPLFSQSFTVLGNGKAVFSADDGVNGTELWITDGTAAGTNMVKDIDAGLGSSIPTGLTSLGNGKAVFTAFDAIYGGELWITDGTAAGTNLVKDIATGITGSIPVVYISLGNGKAIFSASVAGTMEQWITDGTSAGTVSFKDIFAGTAILPNSANYNLFTSLGNGKAVFSADDGINGTELWITDGTTAGTSLVKNIETRTSSGINGSIPMGITSLGNGKAVFSASDANYGTELWITDGTAAGTNLVKDIAAGGITLPNFFYPNNSYPSFFTSLGNGKILFTANDSLNGNELWVTDGTTAGTYLVKDIAAGATSSYPSNFISLGYEKVSFSATNALGVVEQWITDGTSTGTLLSSVANAISGYSNPTSYIAMGSGKLLFSATDVTNGTELWITDGTAAGATLLKDINLATASSNPSPVTMLSIGTVSSNTAPTGLAISTSSVNENVVANTVIGTLTSTDPDAANTFTYSLVPGGVDNAAFSIVGDKLQINTSPNFEAKASYNVLVRTTDQGGLFFDKALTITINNLNEHLTLGIPATVNYTDTPFVDDFINQTGTHQTGLLVGIPDPNMASIPLIYGIASTVGVTVTDNLDGTVSGNSIYGTLTVNKITGAYSFIPDKTTIEPLGAPATNSSLTVTVTDGLLNASQTFTVAIAQSGITETNGNDSLTGTTGNDTINGLAGNDTLDGGVSDVYNPGVIDKLNGGAGDDSFLVRGFFGAGVYDGGVGTDTLDFSQSDAYTAGRRSAEGAGVNVDLSTGKATTYYLSATNFTWSDANGQIAVSSIENVIGTDQGDRLSGDANANSLVGGAGNDTLMGVGSNDTLVGGTGNDTYIIDSLTYVLVEAANAGSDTVQASINFDLNTVTAIENLTLTGTASTGTGDGFDNSLIGNSLSNTLNGGGGNDTLDGGVSDVYNPGVIDTLNGEAGNDTFLVHGFFGAGVYDGGVGTDTLDFSQADTYTAGRRSVEGAGIKVDLAATISNGIAFTYYNASTNFTWTDASGQIQLFNIENVRGSSQSDLISGDGNANTLDGGVSDVYNPGVIDKLNGGAGDDSFLVRGFFGAGVYDGGVGTDTLDFSPADTYTAGRRSAEGAGVNVDLSTGKASTYYLSASNYTWADANGQLALTGIENVIGTDQGDRLSGDANANSLVGGAGNDTLIGVGSNDTLVGGTGNDTYIIDSLTYVLVEAANAGSDTVQASINFNLNTVTAIENLTLTGTASTGTGDGFDNSLIGNSLSNTLNGGGGNDTLDGGVSDVYNLGVIDTLNGEAGNDTFLVHGFFGAGVYDGGVGTDTLDFSQSDTYTAGRRSVEDAGIKVDLAATISNGIAFTYYNASTNFTWTDASGQIQLFNIENVRGSSQSDLISGDGNANTLDGGVSDVYNPGVIDKLNGGAGDDSFLVRGFFGAGVYDGGVGTDTLDFSQSDTYTAARRSAEGAGVNVDLSTGKASTYYLSASNFTWADANGQIAVSTIENVIGTDQGDRLSGDANANSLVGGAGNDVLVGGENTDTLIGGLGKDTNYLTETTPSTDTVSIATGDSLVTSYDLVYGFGLGTSSISTTGVDNLHLASTVIAANGIGDGTDVGTGVNAISSHSISNGIISFDSLGAYDAPVAITATNLANVFSYLQANIMGGNTVAFVSEGNTFVFQDGGATDTLVELVGVTAFAVNTSGSVAGAVWLV